jgi:hypothetical protein
LIASVILVGSLAMLAGCSSEAASSTDPTSAPEQDVTAAKTIGNWECSPDDNVGANFEEFTVGTNKKGKTSVFLSLSGPGDFIEDFHYATKATTSPNGDIVLTGTNMDLRITKSFSKKEQGFVSAVTLTVPKSAELYSGETYNWTMYCSKQ